MTYSRHETILEAQQKLNKWWINAWTFVPQPTFTRTENYNMAKQFPCCRSWKKNIFLQSLFQKEMEI